MTSPLGTGVVSTYPVNSGNANIDPFLVWGYRWGSGPLGAPATVTYSFPAAGATWIGDYWDNEPFNGFSAFNAAQQTAAKQALAAWSEVANITFVQVADTPSNVGDIRFANSNVVAQVGASAWAYFPYETPGFEFPEAGDVWFNPKYSPNFQLQPGQFGYATMLHEIGHAIGLDHPFADPGHPGEAALPFYLDNDRYTVMSYTYDFSTLAYASTPQLLDILAIQHIYGANMTTRTGNDSYKFSATTETNSTIWDAGGIDTIDLSNQAGETYINLNEGMFSQFCFHAASGTSSLLGIAYGVTIENARGGSGYTFMTGNAAANQLFAGAGGSSLSGGDGDDKLFGGSRVDYLWGQNGDDRLDAGAGADFLYGDIGNDWMSGGDGNDNLQGYDGSDTMLGGAGNDFLYAELGDDYLDGGAGIDRMMGGAGNDTYVVDNAGDIVDEESNPDTWDIILASVSVNLANYGTGIEHAYLLGNAALNLTGNSLSNQLIGNGAANVLDGGGGADNLIGGDGNDTYIVDDVLDSIVEAAAGGTDVVKTSFTYSLAALANVENLTLTGGAAVNATGNGLNNVLTGNGAANRLDGGAGGDTLVGGLGDDTYVVDSAGDYVYEATGAGGGTDTVESSIAFTLSWRTNIENLTLTGVAAIDGQGNALANLLRGNSATNVLDGGLGADTLKGGAGDDVYIIDNAGDTIDEEGNTDTWDLVMTTISVNLATIGTGVEHAYLLGNAALNLTGNSGSNQLIGNGAANVLDGGGGPDNLIGGGGDDTYIVDNVLDSIVETTAGAAGGTDLVQSSVTFSLATFANVENLTLTGGAAINATGNSLNNVLTGNGAANRLDGGTGSDTLIGGLGDDTYVVDSAGDFVSETTGAGGGTDTVESSIAFTLSWRTNIENLTLTGNAAIDGQGNALANVLRGNGADNVLDGDLGADTLKGGAGNDTYIVDNAGDTIDEEGNTDTWDLVLASVSVNLSTIGTGLEHAYLLGNAALNLTGNSAGNQLIGNGAANVLDGGSGADNLIGGGGDDTYIVDDVLDGVVEATAGGTDLVQSSVTYSLAALANVENLTLTGGAAINATGNALNNVLTGNGAANQLDGGAGSDTLTGGGGRDTFDYNHLTDAGDTITDFVLGAAGDIIDLADLLDGIGYGGADPFADAILAFVSSGSNTLVQVDADGGGAGAAVTLATITNVALSQANTDNYTV